jgi:hypothetical protein
VKWALLLLLAHSPVQAAPAYWSVRSDVRVDLISTVQILADGYDENSIPTVAVPYAETILKHARVHRKHPVIKGFRKLASKEGRIGQVSRALLYYGPPPGLRPRDDVPYDEIGALGGKESWEGFLSALRDFAIKTDFAGVYMETKPLRVAILKDARAELAGDFPAERFVEYVGAQPMRQLRFIIAPLLHTDKMVVSNRVNYRNNVVEQIRPYESWRGYNFTMFGNSAGHDFVHELAPDLPAEVWGSLRGYPVSKACFWTKDYWADCLEEQLVYAVTLRVEALQGGAFAAESRVEPLETRGFDRVRNIMNALESLEQDKKLRAPLASLLPELAKAVRKGHAPSPEASTAAFWLEAARIEIHRMFPKRAAFALREFDAKSPTPAQMKEAAALRKRLKNQRRPSRKY